MRWAAVFLVPMLLVGCIAFPIPHDHPYSPALSGTVIDSQTKAPIAGAEIRLEGTTSRPPIVATTKSDSDGRFSVLASERVFWLPFWFGFAEGHCTATATVSVAGYEPQTKEYIRFWSASGVGVCGHYTEVWSISLSRAAPNKSLERTREEKVPSEKAGVRAASLNR
jgi:hypothetical protein